MKIKEIYSSFIAWLNGLIEDDPIPYEIKSLVFYISSNNEIGFSGTEQTDVKIVDKFFFHPLEAQYFFCPKLYSILFEITKEQKLNFLKSLLEKLKLNKNFAGFNLFYGFMFEKAKKIVNKKDIDK